jgi:hypothetical protein
MRLSKNPEDYIFCVGKMMDGWGAMITPAKYFEKEGYAYDQHLPVHVEGWGQEMEGWFSCEEEKPSAAMHDDLIAQGFVYSAEFATFMSVHGFEEIFNPPVGASLSVVSEAQSDKIHFLMISTGYVESQSVGMLLVRHRGGFFTGEEVVKDFSRVVKIVVEEGRQHSRAYSLKACCKAVEQANPDAEFCQKCGTRIRAEEADHQDLRDYVDGLLPGSLDSLGQDWETFDENGWEVPAQMVPGRMVLVHHFHPVIEGVEDEEKSEHYYNEYSYSDIGMGPKVKKQISAIPRESVEVAPGVHQVTTSGSIFAAPVGAAGNQNFVIGTTACVNVPSVPSGKIGTDECKQFIVDLILANPGLVAKEFSPVDAGAEQLATIPKNWSRTSKGKVGTRSLREFDCKPLDDQLRASIWDDGTKIIQVEIQGE